jgi:hypothetical protein
MDLNRIVSILNGVFGHRILIVLCLRGGLGNQFFQYAASSKVIRRLSKYQYCFVVNTSYYTVKQNSRKIQIERLIDTLGIKHLHGHVKNMWLAGIVYALAERIWRKYSLKITVPLIKFIMDEADLEDYCNAPYKAPIVLIGGYLQSNRYPPDLITVESQIAVAFDKVALHLRLGDYMIKPYSNIYEIISDRYIKSALERIEADTCQKVSQLMVFSENINESRAFMTSLDLPSVEIIYEHPRTAIEDATNMASYRYRILSNSTFSLLIHHISNSGVSYIPKKWFKTMSTPDKLLIHESEAKTLVVIDK